MGSKDEQYWMAQTPANEQARAQVGQLAQAVQDAVEEPVHLAFVDQGYTGEEPRPPPAKKALIWKSSSTTRPSADLCYCLGVGWWNDRLPGPRVFAGWRVITSASAPPS